MAGGRSAVCPLMQGTFRRAEFVRTREVCENLMKADRNRRIVRTPAAGASRLLAAALLIVFVLAIAGVFRLLQRRAEFRALAKETEVMAVPTVAVIHATAEA